METNQIKQEEEKSQAPQTEGQEEQQSEDLEAQEALESEARESGWVPREQFRGSPDEWIDASAFVKRGREINPLLRKNNEKLLKELRAAKAELAEVKLTTKEFAAEFAIMKENAYKRAISELKAQKREALKSDDLELVDQIEDRIEELRDAQPKAKPQAEEPKAPDMTAFNEWHSENKWYDEDKNPELFDAAEGIALRLSRSDKGLVGKAFLERVTQEVRKRYPEQFENPRRSQSTHEGSKNRGASGGARTYGSLPPDARSACDRFVKQGIMTREQYLETYDWE